jgi:hypothetical protein
MLTIIKASVVGSTLMLLASCTYLTNYQAPCLPGHVCECVQHVTVYRAWVDCRPAPLNRPHRPR